MSARDILVPQCSTDLTAFKPETLDEMALAHHIREWAKRVGAEGPRHMGISGPPGTGKDSLIRCLGRCWFGPNASNHIEWLDAGRIRGIQDIDERVIPMMRTGGGVSARLDKHNAPFVIVLNEADAQSMDAQRRLKKPMEDYKEYCVLIWLTNHPEKLDDAIVSRMEGSWIQMTAPPVDERARVLALACDRFGVRYEGAVVEAWANRESDMRQLLGAARDHIRNGELRLPPPVELVASGEAWHEEVDGQRLLTGLVDLVPQYIAALPPGAALTIALWIIFTHWHPTFLCSPMLMFTAAIKGSGKTRALRVLKELVRRGKRVTKPTRAAIMRYAGHTVLVDEADYWLTDKTLVAVLNSGHQHGSPEEIVIGGEVKSYDPFYPKAIALNRRLPIPETLRDRSIEIPMVKHLPHEVLFPFRADQVPPVFRVVRLMAARWVADNLEALARVHPPMPPNVSDRLAENFAGLLGIADVMGGVWPDAARKALLLISGGQSDKELLLQLIDAIRVIFDSDPTKPERLPSKTIIAKLVSMFPEAAWQGKLSVSLGGQRQLANWLKAYDIRPKSLYTPAGYGDDGYRGYTRAMFEDAWARYGTRDPL